MKPATALAAFACLSSPHRLAIFRLLVRHAPGGRVAGEIATALGMAPANLSFHLKALTHSGLLQSRSEGRYQRYRANLRLMQELIIYLTEECCTGENEGLTETPPAQRCRPAAWPQKAKDPRKPCP